MYTLIQPNNVEIKWPMVAPWIAQAIGNSDTWRDLDTIKQLAIEGTCRIFVGMNLKHQIDIVLVTETWFLEGRKVLVLRWLAGQNMTEWFDDFHLVEAWAASQGFQDIHIWGRPGFVKQCKSLGFRHEFTVISKPIKRGLQ